MCGITSELLKISAFVQEPNIIFVHFFFNTNSLSLVIEFKKLQ
ncbi:MAG: hypothetical protein Q8S84_06170 [bacterium]|nr:hypothetical protein [bacterium]MDP3381060.1 hypothetical protein [bacterium]